MEHASYRDRAALYDLAYHAKDYESEAWRVRQLLTNCGLDGDSRILEVACGTGRHMEHLTKHFRMTGTDLNEAMLEIARGRVPDTEFFAADMAALTVEHPFDALLCLFSSIGYMHGEERLRAALTCFAGALEPGGVVVIEPWLTRDEFVVGTPSLYTWEDNDLKIARACVVRADGPLSILEFHWMVARRGEGVERFCERHELWMFSRRQFLDAMTAAGFQARHHTVGLTDSRGLYVGRKL